MTKILASAVSRRAPLFLANWTGANAEWQTAHNADFVLKNGTTRANLQTSVNDLGAKTQIVHDDEVAAAIEMARRDGLEATTHHAMDSWRKAVIYQIGDAPEGADLPTLPHGGDGISSIIKTLKEANMRWIAINAATDVPDFTPPLVLKDGTTQVAFAALIADLQSSVDALAALEDGLPIKRATRDNAASATYELFKLYRAGVEAEFPDASPVLQTLPTLQPRDTGHTPDPVVLTGRYDAPSGEGLLSWTASSDPDFDHYAVKILASSRYKESDALQIGELAQGVLNFAIPSQFLQRGATLTAVVYVVLTDGRQSGSNVVTFVVPV